MYTCVYAPVHVSTPLFGNTSTSETHKSVGSGLSLNLYFFFTGEVSGHTNTTTIFFENFALDHL